MKLIKLLILIIIFSGGVYVGYTQLPQRDETMSAVISMPDLQTFGTDISNLNAESAYKIIAEIKKYNNGEVDLSAEQKQEMLRKVESTLLLQQYKIRQYRYQAEIAKNKINSPSTSEFTKAAQDFNNTKKTLEKYFEEQALLTQQEQQKQEAAQQEKQDAAQTQTTAK